VNNIVRLFGQCKVLIICGICCLFIAALCLVYVKNMSFTKARVRNTSDERMFVERNVPELHFISQTRNAHGLEFFREQYSSVVATSISDELVRLAELRHWSRQQQGEFTERKWKGDGFGLEDPVQYLKEQRSGVPGACRRFAYILTGVLLSAGFDARLVHFASDFNDDTFNHTLVEVWVDSLNKWILIDSDYDTFYLIDGHPASLFEMYKVVQSGDFRRISFERNGSSSLPEPKVFKFDNETPSLLVRSIKHIYISNTNAFFDGYRVSLFGKRRIEFIHYSKEPLTPAYPEMKKIVLLLTVLLSLVVIVILFFVFIGRVYKLFTQHKSGLNSRCLE